MKSARSVSLKLPALLAFAAGVCGCINGVGWLPDSSGFVFTTDTGKLVHYDLQKRALRVLAKDMKSNTFWPAVSPDGKQIAVGRVAFNANKATLHVVVYDFAGKVVHESPALPWGASDKDDDTGMKSATQLFWAPKENKLLIYAGIHGTHGTTGVYDLDAKKAQIWENSVPTAYGGSPIRPDGKEFLVGQFRFDTGTLAGLDVVDWNGKSRRINIDAPAFEDDKMIEVIWPLLRVSEWRGNTATVATVMGRILVDTDKATFTREAVKAEDLKLQRDDIWSEVKLAGGTRICVLADAKKGTVEKFEVVSYNPTRKQRFVIVEEGSDRLVTIMPSPDKKFAVVRVYEGDRRGPDADMLYVVNDFGRVVQTVDVFDRFDQKE